MAKKLTQSVLRGLDSINSFLDANDYGDSELRQLNTKAENKDITAARDYLTDLVQRKLRDQKGEQPC